VRAYKARGYAGIIVTDHFLNGNSACPRNLDWDKKMEFVLSGYVKAKAEGDKCGLDVFLGWEWCLAGTEFLTYGLSADFLLAHHNLDTLTIEQYCTLVRKHGGYNAQAHPFRRGSWIDNPFPVEPGLMDGVEAYNASMPDEVNRKARDFARRHNLPIQAGSDSHEEDIYFASGVGLARKAKSIFDIIEAIKTGTAELIIP
jgi:predicted metal-dependent phosphoesterase TrpH